MANQKGIIPIQGTVGNLTFYQNDGVFNVRQKSSLDGKRIAKDPRFQRTRENGQEFRRAGNASKVFRAAFNTLLQRIGDKRVTARLVQKLHGALKGDVGNLRGERTVEAGNVLILQGFDFNAACKLDSTFYAPYFVSIDRDTGAALVDIPAMRPSACISAPKGCTHYNISVTAAEIDFAQGIFAQAQTDTGEQMLTNDEQPATTLSVQLAPGSSRHIFLVMSIEFFQQLNGKYYLLSNGSHAAMQVVAVSPKA